MASPGGKLGDNDSTSEYANIHDLTAFADRMTAEGYNDPYEAKLRAAIGEGYAVLVQVWDSNTSFVVTADGKAARRL
jgi:hypothetical protein